MRWKRVACWGGSACCWEMIGTSAALVSIRHVQKVLRLLLLAGAVTSLGLSASAEAVASVRVTAFGELPDGRAVDLYTLGGGGESIQLSVTNLGATIVNLVVPDREGRPGDIVLGFDRAEDYFAHTAFLGATVGRFANRIAGGEFVLDGERYVLPTNNTPGGIACTLHGGEAGFHKELWTARTAMVDGRPVLELTLVSPDGAGGFPGQLTAKVTFSLPSANDVRVDYEAVTTRPTPVNVTNHTYFNLRGEGSGDVLGHRLVINGDRITPVDAGLIPTGELAPVHGTPFDFLTPRTIGERIGEEHEQLRMGAGYDHNWVLDRTGAGLVVAATLHEPDSGRVMDVLTTEPGLQFYSGNYLDGTLTGKSGRTYERHGGLCLEPQHFPDSPNQPTFPNTILRPGEVYRSTTIYRFSNR